MGQLALAAILFVAGHFAVSSTGLRPWLLARLGELPYRGLYSLMALGLLAWTVVAYGAAPFVEVWSPPSWLAGVPLVVMPFALLLLVAGVSQPNATAVAAPAAARKAAPRGIFAVTRHPVMWGIGLWALAHLAANGDGASMILFAALAFLALAGTRAIEARKARDWGADWPAFAAASSNLPLLALVQGRAKFALADLGWWRIALALVLYAVLIGAHPHVIGVATMPI